MNAFDATFVVPLQTATATSAAPTPMEETDKKADSRIARVIGRFNALWSYVTGGLWSDPRRNWWVNGLRIVNLSVNSFLNKDIQTQACAMTYRTMLAVVPALALLLAIGRGFGIQELLQQELYRLFPAQHTAIRYAMGFVDSYLSQVSGGIFVGVGIIFLLYTLISLLSNVEQTFNMIWGQKTGRSLWRKISDYSTILLILPVLMICSGGLTLMLSHTLNAIFRFDFMTPVISMILEGASWVMIFLFFTAAYMLLPNTKVKFLSALISGTIAGTGFLVLQWLFVTGTLYVAKYNAIYGSFAFLPLMLLWMQLVWVITLAGAVICYSSQNVFAFSLNREVTSISDRYRAMVTLAITAIITRRFLNGEKPLTAHDLMSFYDLPAQLVTGITDRMCADGILNRILLPEHKDVYGFQLAVDPSTFTVGRLTARMYTDGTAGFIPHFRERFPGVGAAFAKIESTFGSVADDMLIADILPTDPAAPKPRNISY